MARKEGGRLFSPEAVLGSGRAPALGCPELSGESLGEGLGVREFERALL